MERTRVRDQLRLCRKGKTETLDELAMRVKELARKAYPKGKPGGRGPVISEDCTSYRQGKNRGDAMVDECIPHLIEVEALEELTQQVSQQRTGKARRVGQDLSSIP